jgi:hypothetical protein
MSKLRAQRDAAAIAREAERSHQRTLMGRRHIHHMHLRNLDIRAQYGQMEDVVIFVEACDAFIAQWGEDKLSWVVATSLRFMRGELTAKEVA